MELTLDKIRHSRFAACVILVVFAGLLTACSAGGRVGSASRDNTLGPPVDFPWTIGTREGVNDWFDAVELAQGHSTDGEIDVARVQEIHHALTSLPAVRGWRHTFFWIDRPIHSRRYASVGAIYFAPSEPNRAILLEHSQPTDVGWREFVNGETGIDALDRLVRQCRGEIGFGQKDGSMLMVSFNRMVDVQVMAQRFSAIEGIDAWANWFILDEENITLDERGDRWHFTFSRGWGDCPAGCSNREFYFATWDRNRKTVIAAGFLADVDLRNKRELGNEWRDSLLWAEAEGAETHAVRTLDDIEAALQSDLPWLNKHMVQALYYGLHIDRDVYWPHTRLKKTIRAAPDRAGQLLRDAAEKHPDAEVRQLAKSLIEGPKPE